MREPSDPLIMTASPGWIGGEHLRLRAPPRSRHSRPGAPEGSASHSARISGPQQNTRSTPCASTGSASPRCRSAPRGPSSSMSPSTAMRRPRGPTSRLPEQRERRPHRGRIGVVALVDQQRRAARQLERDARAASGRRLQLGERERRERKIGADERGRRQHRERIEHEMPARRAELVGDVGAEDARLHGRAVRLQRALEQPCVGARRARRTRRSARRRRCCALRASRPNCGLSRLITAAPPRLEPEEDLRLGVGDRLERAEEFEMHRLDRGDDRDLRAHQAGERLDLAGMVHADLEHGVARALRAARERQRHAPMIVVGGDRGMGLAVARRARAAAPPWCRSCRPSR